MKNRMIVATHSLLVMALLAAPSFAADPDEALKKDLTSVIALQGQPCGEVVAVKTQAKNDYAATCKDGNKYQCTRVTRGVLSSKNRSDGFRRDTFAKEAERDRCFAEWRRDRMRIAAVSHQGTDCPAPMRALIDRRGRPPIESP
jgi:hypothetical protein